MIDALIYSLLRVVLDVLVTSHRDQAELQSDVLALRRQVQVLERQIKRVRWTLGDRMLMLPCFDTSRDRLGPVS